MKPVLLALAVVALAGCHGGGMTTIPHAPSQAHANAPTLAVAFRVTIPRAITNTSHGRKTLYVSASTKSITVSEQPSGGGSAATSTSNCSASLCEGTLQAPLGMGTFTISLFDGLNGGGNLLSKGSKVQTIVPNVTNVVSVSFAPNVAALVVNVEPTALEMSHSGVTYVQVIATDAAGNTIIGPGSFPNPITIASSDTSGAITLKTNTITDIGQTVEVVYNGATIANPTISATVAGVTSSTTGTLALVANLSSINGDFTGDIPDSAASLDGVPYDDQTSAQSILRYARAHSRRASTYGQPGGNEMVPGKVDLSSQMSPVLNQGQQGSCGAFSLSYAILSYQQKLVHNWSYFLSDGVTPDNTHLFSAAFLYNSVNGGTDGGSTLTGNLAFEAANGNATLVDTPYNPADFLTQPSATAKQNAMGYRITQYARVDPKNTNAVKAQLAAGNAVYWAMMVDSNFQALTGQQVWKGPIQAGAGGHAMALAGYDDSLGAFIIRNSWGTDWGNNGYGYIDYGAFAKYTLSAFVIKVADLTNPALPNPLPTPQLVTASFDPNATLTQGPGFQIGGTLTVSPVNAASAQVNVSIFTMNPDGATGPRAPATSAQYSDGAGNAATGTAPMPVPADGLNAVPWSASMPYSALGVQPGQSSAFFVDTGLLLDGSSYPLSAGGYTVTVTNTGTGYTAQSSARKADTRR